MKNCPYEDGYSEALLQGLWRVNIYSTQSGQKVASFTINGDLDTSELQCEESKWFAKDGPKEIDNYTSPSAGYASPLSPLVNGVARK